MARAVPRLFRVVPSDDAAQVRADGRALMQAASRIAINSDFAQAMADNGSCSRLDFFNARDVSAGDPAGILLSHVQIFFGELAGRSHGPAGWIIKRGPWIGAPENEVGQKQAGDRAMRHPHSRIAGGDEDFVA